MTNKFNDIPKRKIGYSIIGVFKETLEEAILNSDRSEKIICELPHENEFIRMNEYIKLFLDYDGAEALFNYIKDAYNLTENFDEDIKMDIEHIIKNYDNYTCADLLSEGDKAVKSAEEYLEEMNNY